MVIKWHYLAVKSLFALFKGITSNHVGYFYCLNCFHSFRTENKLKNHKNVFKNYDYCYLEMTKEDNKILNYNHGEKWMKIPFNIYADMESLLEKMSTYLNNPKKSLTTKMSKHPPSACSLFTYCTFDTTKNKFDYNRGIDCMKGFCKDLKKHATEIINLKKKEIIQLSIEENEPYLKKELCHKCKKRKEKKNKKTDELLMMSAI